MQNVDLVQLTAQTKKLTAMIVEDEKVTNELLSSTFKKSSKRISFFVVVSSFSWVDIFFSMDFPLDFFPFFSFSILGKRGSGLEITVPGLRVFQLLMISRM